MPNPYVNKVQLSNGTTLMDLTGDTVTAGDVLAPKSFHLASGAAGVGTLGDFGGADGTNAGTHGLVPAPAATDNTKFLKGDGTWQAVASGAVTLLWENSSHTSNFNAQTISNLSPFSYSWIYIVYKREKTDTIQSMWGELFYTRDCTPASTDSLYAALEAASWTTESNRTNARGVSIRNDNIYFDDAYYNNSKNNAHVIPTFIYGIA